MRRVVEDGRADEGYAERYLNYPLHDIHGKPTGGGGHVTPQTLDESTWSIPLIQGFDCVKEQLSAEDIAFISEKMLLPCAYHIKKHQWGIHNICCWHNSAYGLAGLTLGKSDLVYGAIFGPKGFLAQVEKGVTDDGPWYERAWGYHFYTMSAMRPLEEAIMNTKIVELPKRYKLMYDAPLKFLTPTYQLPAFHDSARVGFNFASFSGWYEGAYTAWRDPIHGEIVKSGKRNSLEATLFGVADIQTSGSTFKSEDYHDAGIAVLRTQSPKLNAALIPSNFIALDYGEHGGGHGHPDKLNYVLYAHNQLIAEDPGCIAYGNPAHGGWYRQTVSHNTLVVDGKSQAPATGHCLAFVSMPDAALCVAEAGPIYKGVKAYRAVAMIGDYVFDILWADSNAEHQYEYAFHARGTLAAAQEGAATDEPQGDGYKWAKDWKLLKTAPVQDFVWTQEKVKLALSLKQLPSRYGEAAVRAVADQRQVGVVRRRVPDRDAVGRAEACGCDVDAQRRGCRAEGRVRGWPDVCVWRRYGCGQRQGAADARERRKTGSGAAFGIRNWFLWFTVGKCCRTTNVVSRSQKSWKASRGR